MKQLIKGFVAGFLVCAGLSTVVAHASGVWKEIFYGIKVEVNGVAVNFADDSQPFVMDGRTFLPLRAIGETLGLPVDYDADLHTAYVGKKPGGMSFTETVPPYQISSSDVRTETHVTMGGEIYTNALRFYNKSYSLHNLNGQYTRLTGYLGHVSGHPGTVIFNFYGDGNLIASYTVSGQDLPQQISINLTGVLQLKIEQSDYIMGGFAFASGIIE